MKTYSPKPRDIERRWYVIDAEGAVLGRLASEVAKILRGKHKPIFAPHADTGDHVIVVNAKRVRLTGAKEETKLLVRHSGYPGGIRTLNYGRLMAERPARAVERAVRGMLPKNRLGRAMARKLSVYEGPTHPHVAQRPESLTLGQVPKWEGLPKPKPKPAPEPTAPVTKRATRGRASATSKARGPATRGAGAARRGSKTGAPARGPKATTARRPPARPKATPKAEAAEAPTKKEGAPRTTRARRPKKSAEES